MKHECRVLVLNGHWTHIQHHVFQYQSIFGPKAHGATLCRPKHSVANHLLEDTEVQFVSFLTREEWYNRPLCPKFLLRRLDYHHASSIKATKQLDDLQRSMKMDVVAQIAKKSLDMVMMTVLITLKLISQQIYLRQVRLSSRWRVQRHT